MDWRRSFITTDMNPFYDSFTRWQFWTLYRQVFGGGGGSGRGGQTAARQHWQQWRQRQLQWQQLQQQLRLQVSGGCALYKTPGRGSDFFPDGRQKPWLGDSSSGGTRQWQQQLLRSCGLLRSLEVGGLCIAHSTPSGRARLTVHLCSIVCILLVLLRQTGPHCEGQALRSVLPPGWPAVCRPRPCQW